MPVLELCDISRTFKQGEDRLDVLRGAKLKIRPGEIVALVGPSGAGKSTLLHIAGLLERPDAGQVVIDGVDGFSLSDEERTRIRREKIGFVYQFHHLLPEFTALENVALPQRVNGVGRRQAMERAAQLLSDLGLDKRLNHQPMQLSGGEQQRVAIARALANRPMILLADEPTGNLDPDTSSAVFDSLIALVRQQKLAALIATHNFDLARRMDRIVRVADGRIEPVEADGVSPLPSSSAVPSEPGQDPGDALERKAF